MPLKFKPILASDIPLGEPDKILSSSEALELARTSAPAARFMIYDPGEPHHGATVTAADLAPLVWIARQSVRQQSLAEAKRQRRAKAWMSTMRALRRKRLAKRGP